MDGWRDQHFNPLVVHLFPTVMHKQVAQQPYNETNPAPRTSPLTLFLALFLFLLSVYLLTYSPRFHSSDGLAMFATAESLARRGEWDIDQIRWMGLQQGTFGLDEHLYSRKGAGVSLLALPLVWLGLVLPGWGTATAALLFNSLVTAATGTLLMLYVHQLGYDIRVALVTSLIFGLTTPAWPYAKTFFSDPLAALCLIAAALALLRFRDNGRAANAFWAGLALAVAITTRYANVVVVPFFGLLLLKYQITNQQTPAPQPLRAAWPQARVRESANQPTSKPPNHKSQITNRRSLISNLQVWMAFGIPLIAIAIAIAYYNVARYGNPFNTGYLPQESFNGIWWQGITGLLVSPGRGLFLYAPVLLLALPAAPTFFRRHHAEAGLAGAIILAHVLLYGKWFMWHGGYAWGPRFMVPTLPFFVLGMAPAIEYRRESVWWRVGFLVLATLSGLIQVFGLSVHFELFQNRLLDTGLPLFAPITFFDPRYSPLIGQFQFLRPKNLDFAWIAGSQVDWSLLAALFLTVLLSGWGLVRIVGRMEGWKIGRLEGWKGGRLARAQASTLPILQPSSISPLVVLAATTWLLVRAHTLPTSELHDAMAVLNTRTTSVDAVITGTPDESAAFGDLYKGRADVLGLNAGGPPLDIDTTAALVRTIKNHQHVWWLPNWLPPEQSGVELWLMRNGFRAEDYFLGRRRLAHYFFPSQPLTKTTVGATFGSLITLERVSTLSAAHSGSVLPITLYWRAMSRVPADYHVFVHLINTNGNIVAQSDGQPALWTRPTSGWSPGEEIEDRHGLPLPANLLPGNYTLIAGLYQPENGERLLAGKEETFVPVGSVQIARE